MAAYAELAGVRFEDAAYPEAIATSEQSSRLASKLGLPEPSRALGFGAGARCFLGERQGLEDIRRALALSLERGKGREAGVHYANLAEASWHYEGPQAALTTTREGVEFCERRGIGEVALSLASFRPVYLTDLGRCDEALADAESLVERAEATGNIPALTVARSVQLRLLAYRGEEEQSAAAGEQLADRARSTGVPWEIGFGLGAAAQHLLTAGRPDLAETLLRELAQVPGVPGTSSYSLLPELVRCALSSSGPELAAEITDGFEPHTPLQEHALVAARAALAEAASDHVKASTLYAEAAERGREFGNVPERAYALLGHGRCLIAVGHAGAEESLRQAGDLFTSIGYRPALAEAQRLLEQTTAAAS